MTPPFSDAPDTMLVIRDRYFAPSSLSPFADDLARRLSRISIGPLLEICADVGVLTQAIASAMSAGLTIIATDPSADTIGHASIKPGMARIAWQLADPLALPFPDATFGIVTGHFGVASLPDRVKAFQEARRVMKADGRFVFSVPAHIRHNPVAECIQGAMDDLFPSDSPRFVGHALHGFADNEMIDDDLTAAGFTDAIYTTVEMPFAAASAREVAIGYCLGTPLRIEIEARAPGDAEQAIQAAVAVLEKRFGTGPINAGMRAHIVSASG
jgi:ubiquinone/menaquinone biosynthesis C-methylase UbiE